MGIRSIIIALTISISIPVFFSCSKKVILNHSQLTVNSKATLKKPYLILISLDGFRWDYVERFNPPNLSRFIKNGVKAVSLIPSFPSKTFPNHYTIATGMYPDNHGLLGNMYYSYEKGQKYAMKDKAAVMDGTWYGGTPIWVQATKAGMVTASYFFVGSEADIQGIRPTYYYKYDGSVKNEIRVDQTLKWLDLPEKVRPHLITLYFSDMDDTGHAFGPNNDDKLNTALSGLDRDLGNLFDGVKKRDLDVNIIIVSDHGMKEISSDKYLPVEMVEDDDQYMTVNNGAMVSILPLRTENTDSIFASLKLKENKYKVFKTENTPYFEYVPKNKNWGKIQIIPDDGYYFVESKAIALLKASTAKVSGQHGFDPGLKQMHGIFYAQGPAFKMDYLVPSFKNIHIYPLMCEILGLKIPADVDGKSEVLESVLKNH